MEHPDKIAACHGKIGYPTYAAAHNRVSRQASRGRNGGRSPRFSIYRCPHCHAFHVGGRGD